MSDTPRDAIEDVSRASGMHPNQVAERRRQRRRALSFVVITAAGFALIAFASWCAHWPAQRVVGE